MNQITPTEPTRTWTMPLRALRDDNWLLLTRMQGICSTHSLYMSEDATVLAYVEAPDGGEINALRRWADGLHTLPAWDLQRETGTITQFGATLWVVERACQEVAAEVGIEITFRNN